MGERLEPCPFCGGVPETVDATRILGIWRIVHRCDVLGCVSVGREDIKDAAVEWNRRAASPDAARVATLERELAAMREARDALSAAVTRCGENWGWWNEGDPPIVAMLPQHPAVLAAVEAAKRASLGGRSGT
jgi:hypothetical protein